jgi:hypothetical protein
LTHQRSPNVDVTRIILYGEGVGIQTDKVALPKENVIAKRGDCRDSVSTECCFIFLRT